MDDSRNTLHSVDKHLALRKKWLMTLALTPIFTVLMIVSAKLSIPLPILPISFQVTVAILSGLLLGPRLGFLSQLLYLLMGLVGLPVFSRGGGIEYIFTGSFGYIIGFLLAAPLAGVIAGKLSKNSSQSIRYTHVLLASLVALFAAYVCGVAYLFALSNFYTDFAGSKDAAWITVLAGAGPYFVKDILLSVFAAELARRLWKVRPRKLTNS